jgi:hypothetical protein
MPQVNEPGYAVALQAVRDVRKVRSPHATQGRAGTSSPIAQLAHMSRVVTHGKLAAARSTAMRSLLECRGRRW